MFSNKVCRTPMVGNIFIKDDLVSTISEKIIHSLNYIFLVHYKKEWQSCCSFIKK